MNELKYSKRKQTGEKKTKKKKKKSRRKLLQLEIEDLCKSYIKKRDKHTCQHCGRQVTGRNEQWSHIFPKGRSKFLRWHPLNTKVLCMSCHRWWHDNPLDAAKWLDEKFPGRSDYLRLLYNKGHGVFGISELEEIRDFYIRANENLPEEIDLPGVFGG